MLRTITVGSSVSVQGVYHSKLDNGKITVRVGGELYTGRPV